MIDRTGKLAEKLFKRIRGAAEVDYAKFQSMLESAEEGWTPVEEPENYRWFLVESFPVKDFRITIKDIATGAADPELEQAQHDRIVDLLEYGAEAWPAFVTSSGVIFDGYHRIAAHRTLKHEKMSVVVAVERDPGSRMDWDKAWNKWFGFPEKK
jgi:hypothetical protein